MLAAPEPGPDPDPDVKSRERRDPSISSNSSSCRSENDGGLEGDVDDEAGLRIST